jgi:hypothetical protein
MMHAVCHCSVSSAWFTRFLNLAEPLLTQQWHTKRVAAKHLSELRYGMCYTAHRVRVGFG